MKKSFLQEYPQKKLDRLIAALKLITGNPILDRNQQVITDSLITKGD
jgi:hypothetical protein